MDNLIFRCVQESDLETLREWRMSPEISKFLLTDCDITPEDQINWYNNKVKNSQSLLIWIVQFQGVDIGYVNLSNIDKTNKTADPGTYICNDKFRGIGLGKSILINMEKYAFEVLKFNKLYGPVFAENFPPWISYMKGGWTIEGVLRQHVFKHGEYHDLIMIAMLKETWEKKKDKFKYIEGIFESYPHYTIE